MDKVLAITLYRRPNYTRQLFDALKKCYGVKDYTIFISCDHDDRFRDDCLEVQAMADEFSRWHENTFIYVNNPRLGIDINKLFILPIAFKYSDFVIFYEDDTIPAPDTLRYFEWCRQFKDDPNCIAICTYDRYHDQHYHDLVMKYQSHSVIQKPGIFSIWGWGTWKDRYDRIYGMDGQKYATSPLVDNVNGRFDYWMSWSFESNPEAYCLFPRLPRTQSVGAENAEHTPSAEWHKENEYNPMGAWTQEMPDTDQWELIDDVSNRMEGLEL